MISCQCHLSAVMTSDCRMFAVYHGQKKQIDPRLYRAVRCCLADSRIMASCSCFQLSCFVASTFEILRSCFISHPTDFGNCLVLKSLDCCSGFFGKCLVSFFLRHFLPQINSVCHPYVSKLKLQIRQKSSTDGRIIFTE